MIDARTISNDIISILKKCTNIHRIKSILISGSSIKNDEKKPNDIDFLIICDDSSASTIFNEIKQRINDIRLRKILDIKIIETSQIDFINNSVSIPFFYHFILNSKLLHGINFLDKFVLRKNWIYQSIQFFLEKLEIAKEVFFEYKQYQDAEVILYEIAKRLVIIYDLAISEGIVQDEKNMRGFLISIFGSEYFRIRKKVEKERNWISLYEEKSSKGIFGFNLLKIRRAKEPHSLNKIAKDKFETKITKIKTLAGQCLNIYDY